MSRVEIIKQGISGGPETEVLTTEDAEQWYALRCPMLQKSI